MKVGIQLYSIRQHMAQNPVDTIAQVVRTGYRFLEGANHNAQTDPGVGFPVSAQEIKRVLRDSNAAIVSVHVFPMEPDVLAPVLAYHQEIGTKYIVMPMDFYPDRDSVLRKAEALNKAGEQCKAAGMQLLYHNHFHEFQCFGGETIYSLLMEHTAPENLGIELDTYWAMRAGQDPVALLERYGRRVRLIHQKDYPAGFEAEMNLLDVFGQEGGSVNMQAFIEAVKPETFLEVGKGIMDIQRIIDVGNKACGTEYMILEQDFSQHEEMDSIRISMESFRRFDGVEW